MAFACRYLYVPQTRAGKRNETNNDGGSLQREELRVMAFCHVANLQLFHVCVLRSCNICSGKLLISKLYEFDMFFVDRSNKWCLGFRLTIQTQGCGW